MKSSMTQTAAAIWNLKNLSAEPRWRGKGRTRFLRATRLRHELQNETGAFLRQRRAIVALSLAAVGAMGLISLYQMGIIKHLPQPPLPGLDSDRVDGSAEAYERLSAPDATLAVGSYAATLLLAAMGSKHRAQEQPWLPLALAGKAAFDVAQALRMARVQWTKYKAFCFWCLLSAAATFATAPLVFGEAREALRALGQSDRTQRHSPT